MICTIPPLQRRTLGSKIERRPLLDSKVDLNELKTVIENTDKQFP